MHFFIFCLKIFSIYLNNYILSKINLCFGFIFGALPQTPLLLRPKGVPLACHKEAYILDKLGYASRKAAF